MNSVKPESTPLPDNAGGKTRWNHRLAQIVIILFSLVFAFLSVAGLFETCRLDPGSYNNEHILFVKDNPVLNIAILAVLLIVIAVVLCRIEPKLTDRSILIAKILLGVWVFSVSLLWILSVQTVPTSDSQHVLDAASRAAKNDFSFLTGGERYFVMFPFQLSMVSVFEIVYRVFGSASYTVFCVLNALSLAVSFLALVQITELLFHKRAATFAVILLSVLCIQPVLFSSFIYGTLYGLAAVLWAFVFLIRFLQTRKPLNLLWVLLLSTFAVLLKQNYWIVIAAMGIVLLLSLPRGQITLKLLFLVLIVALPVLLTHSIRSGYERRGNADLGDGTPQTAWLVMGLSNTKNNPGWYNGYTYSVLKNAGWDEAKAKQQIQADLNACVQNLASNPKYALEFFTGKFLSQWNETSFESVWTSKLREHYVEVPAFVHSIYGGSLGRALYFGFDQYTQLVYTLSAFVVLSLWKKKPKRSIVEPPEQTPVYSADPLCVIILPLTVLGGVLYHLLFEAKAYYAIPYLMMLLPIAAYGAYQTVDLLKSTPFLRRLCAGSGKDARKAG